MTAANTERNAPDADQPLAIPTRDALFNAILAEPDCDTTRLVYADYIEENGDTADADLAELVRVECELEPLRSSLKFHSRKDPLYTRERELLAAHPEWLRDLKMPCPGCHPDWHGDSTNDCQTCGGTGDLLVWRARHIPSHPTARRNPTLTRGLTLTVACQLDEVVREVDVRCGRCNGVGEVVDYNAYPVPHQRKACPNCQQRKTVRGWQPTPWALAFRQACVGMGRVPWWRVTDYPPVLHANGKWGWTTSDIITMPLVVRREIASDEFPDDYPTPETARHALELAVYRFVRQPLSPAGGSPRG